MKSSIQKETNQYKNTELRSNHLYTTVTGESPRDIGLIVVLIDNYLYTLHDPHGNLKPFTRWNADIYDLEEYAFVVCNTSVTLMND